MIVVVQRVASATVRVDGRVVGAIDTGLLAYVGVVTGDDAEDAAWIADRLRHLRVFADDRGRMNLSVADKNGALLLVPNFTLAADTSRGRRPSFGAAAAPDQARALFEGLVARLQESAPVETGEFGAGMAVDAINDGPVTLVLDSRAGRVRAEADAGDRQPAASGGKRA